MAEHPFPELIVAQEGMQNLLARPLAKGGAFTCRVSGWSMFPAIANASLIRIEAVDNGSLKAGDIVLAKAGEEKFVVHRIAGKVNGAGHESFMVKGDNQAGQGDRIPGGDIFGKVTAVGRGSRLFSIVNGKGRWRDILCSRLAFATRPLLPRIAKTMIFLQGSKSYRRLARIFFRQPDFTVDRLDENSYYLYACRGPAVIASANLTCEGLLRPEIVEWWISNFRVLLPFRGLGLGRRMLDEIFNLVKSRKGGLLRLSVENGNTPAMKFYLSAGFIRKDGPAPGKNPGGRAGGVKIVLEKNLAQIAADACAFPG